MEEAIRKVLRAREAVERAERDLVAARRRYRRAIVDAHEHGVTLAALGEALGVTRQRVAALIAEEREAE